MKNHWSLGIDIGGTKIEFAALSKEGIVLHKERHDTRSERGFEKIAKHLVDVINSITSKIATKPSGIGIAIAGQVYKDTGAVSFAPNLEWREVPLKQFIEENTSYKARVMNDVRAAGIGEKTFGEGKECSDFLLLFVGTGIGGCIFSNGKLVEGAFNTAAEVGHIVIQSGGRLCSCKQKGCLEAYAGGLSIAKRFEEALKKKGELFLGKDEKITTKEIFKERQKNPLAQEIFKETVTYLAEGIVSLVHTVGPEKVILGGGVIEGAPEISALLLEEVKKIGLPAATKDLKIVPSKLMQDAPVIGAAATCFSKQN